MNGLWSQIVENLGFIAGCTAIVICLSLLAKLAERAMPDMRKVSKARYVSIVGICAAIATVLHMLDFPLLFLAPDFYKVDFSELCIRYCGDFQTVVGILFEFVVCG